MDWYSNFYRFLVTHHLAEVHTYVGSQRGQSTPPVSCMACLLLEKGGCVGRTAECAW